MTLDHVSVQARIGTEAGVSVTGSIEMMVWTLGTCAAAAATRVMSAGVETITARALLLPRIWR